MVFSQVVFCLFFLSFFYTNCFAQDVLDLEALIQEALANNPGIESFQKRKDALWERPSQVKAWDDPLITFGLNNVPVDDFDFNKQDMTQKTVSIKQNVPFPGITSLRGKAAVEQAKSAVSEFEDKKIKVVRDVKKAYFELFFVNESIKITLKNEDLLARFVELTQIKYEVGKGLQEDILTAQVELYKMQEKLINLRQRQTTVSADLIRLLNRNSSVKLSGVPVVKKNTEFGYTDEEIEKMALAGNPLLEALKHDIERSEAEHFLAKKQYFPQFTFTASYGQRDNRVRSKPFPARVTNSSDGTFSNVVVAPLADDRDRPDFLSFFVGVNIPIWFRSKQDKKVSETHYRILQAKSQYESVRNDVCFAVRDFGSRIKRSRELMDLYRASIIPQAEQSLSADMAAYQVARIDFLTLLNSQITLFNFEIEYERAVRDYEKDLAGLEAVVGKRIF